MFPTSRARTTRRGWEKGLGFMATPVPLLMNPQPPNSNHLSIYLSIYLCIYNTSLYIYKRGMGFQWAKDFVFGGWIRWRFEIIFVSLFCCTRDPALQMTTQEAENQVDQAV